jgi:hypothetical protein
VLRFFAGVVSTLLLVAAGFFIWKSQAQTDELIPPAPPAVALVTPLKPERLATPPEATPKSREEKRFARADKDDDGRITKLELLEPRRKAFAKLDVNGNGNLSFEEWAVRTTGKFTEADDMATARSRRVEYASTAPEATAKAKVRLLSSHQSQTRSS